MPSAELRPDQEDNDSLPPYEILDAILIALTEEMADIDMIVERGYDRDLVEHVSKLLFRAEYKRFNPHLVQKSQAALLTEIGACP